MAEARVYGGIELGGTKIVAAVGHDDGTLLASRTFPTTVPSQVLGELISYFEVQPYDIKSVGIGAFGPVVTDRAQADYGHLLETNKPGWSGCDLIGMLGRGLGLPMYLTTDVAAAGVGEARFGALRNVGLGVYLTVGTGIGGAILHNGVPLPALLHPEMGHIPLEREPGDNLVSTCRFHEDCAEGLAAGPAIKARFGHPLSACPPEHNAIGLVAGYLGQLCAQLVLMISPHRIVIGGGVGQTAGLIEQTQAAMVRRLGRYASQGTAASGFLRSAELGQQAGVVGALACAPAAHAGTS